LWNVGPLFTCMLKLHLDCGFVGFENKLVTLFCHRLACACVYTRAYACVYKNKIEYVMGSSP